MHIDFSVMSNYGKVAIKCENEFEASQLVSAMWEEYPDKMKSWWYPGETGFELGTDDHYAPHIYDTYSDCLQVADEYYWISHGYTILPFCSLVQKSEDFGEFETGGLNACDILGVGGGLFAS